MNRAARIALLAPIAVLVLWFVGALVTTGVMFGRDHFEWSPEYRREVRGHVLNAYYADTPELMIEELELAVQGMRDLELHEDVYGDMRPWRQTPDNRMDYQYAHMQAIIDRAHAVIEWREQNGADGEVNDVYGAKVRDLRAFIAEDGWSDHIARNAYYVVQHPFVAWWSDYAFILIGAWVGAAVFIGAPCGYAVYRGSQ